MHDPTDTRSARIADAQHLLSLARRFPCLPFPSASAYLVSFNYTAETDAEAAAGSVRTARRILSEHAGLRFKGDYTKPIGSAQHYMYEAELDSGMFVRIVAQASVGPLVDARQDADAKVPVAA